jgi:hypothetical protein
MSQGDDVTADLSSIWYHGTFTPPPQGAPFSPFTHLGTREAAVELLTDRYYLDDCRGVARIFTFKVPIQLTLLEVPEFDSPDPRVWVGRLSKDERFFKTPDDSVPVALYVGAGSTEDRPVRLARFGVWLKTQGYDGIEYTNEHEAVGSTSIAVADSAHLIAGPVETVDPLELRALFEQVKDRPKYATCREFPSA